MHVTVGRSRCARINGVLVVSRRIEFLSRLQRHGILHLQEITPGAGGRFPYRLSGSCSSFPPLTPFITRTGRHSAQKGSGQELVAADLSLLVCLKNVSDKCRINELPFSVSIPTLVHSSAFAGGSGGR